MTVKRALIVDDSTTAQYHLKKMLQAYDLDIDSVDSGEAALLYLAKHVPDVVFMDHLMPGMDGFRALQIIKSHPETAMVPVIMYTSKSGDVYTGQARALGALDVISKDTINNVELSKVMRSIHIEPRADTDSKNSLENSSSASAVIEQANQPRRESTEKIAVQAAQQLVSDNSRRIELRIVQLEHAIDDSRRVIAAQLIREMQKLRHHIKHEVTRLLGEQQEKIPTLTVTAPVTKERPANNWMLIAIVILLIIVIAVLFNHQRNMGEQLYTIAGQQQSQLEQLAGVEASLLNVQAEQIDQLQRQEALQAAALTEEIPTINLWSDFIWAFNQGGTMPFYPRVFDPNIAIKLHEFVNRLSRQGFSGNLQFNLSVGNFCVAMDAAGHAHLPDRITPISDCMLLTELYPFETMVEQAMTDINAALMGIDAVRNGEISIVIARAGNQLAPYPERESQLPASEWNKAALANNLLTVVARPVAPEAESGR